MISENAWINHANIEVTSSCDQKCVYCFNDSGMHKPKELDTSQWLGVLKILQDRGVKSLLVTGGEPFVKQDTWLLLSKALQMGFEINIISNGFSLDDRLDDKKKEVISKLKRAQISLDSMSPVIHDARRGVKNAWQTSITAIRFLRSLNVKVEISSTISEENIDELEGITEFAAANNCSVLVRPLASTGRGSGLLRGKDLESLIELEKKRLSAIYGDIFVDDFGMYVPVVSNIDFLAADKGIVTILYDGRFRTPLAIGSTKITTVFELPWLAS